MKVKPNLVFTVAIDIPGQTGCRLMAKLLASSLCRTQFSGDVFIFHNSDAPIFFMDRKGVEEFKIDVSVPNQLSMVAEEAWTWKYRVRNYIDAERYDKILFLDADCLVLRNIDHLLEGEWDIAFQRERGLKINSSQFNCFLTDEEREKLPFDGVNSGTLAVRGSIFQKVMQEWERIDTSEPVTARCCSDQASWNRLLLDAQARRSSHGQDAWHCVPFESREIQFPMHLDKDFRSYRNAAILHCLGATNVEKMQFMFGTYMGAFFHDFGGTMLNITDM